MMKTWVGLAFVGMGFTFLGTISTAFADQVPSASPSPSPSPATYPEPSPSPSPRPIIKDAKGVGHVYYKAWWDYRRIPGLSDLEALVYRYANDARTKDSLPPLQYDIALQSAARQHAREMLELSYFSHESPFPQFQTPMQRAYLAGYLGLVGENILSLNNPDARSPQKLARQIVDFWMKSPPHRELLLSKSYNEMAIGIVKQGDQWMASQVFGRTPFRFVQAMLSDTSPDYYLFTAGAMLMSAEYNRAAVVLDGKKMQVFDLSEGERFFFQVKIPKTDPHVVDLYPGKGSSFTAMEFFKIDRSKPLTDPFSPLYGP